MFVNNFIKKVSKKKKKILTFFLKGVIAGAQAPKMFIKGL